MKSALYLNRRGGDADETTKACLFMAGIGAGVGADDLGRLGWNRVRKGFGMTADGRAAGAVPSGSGIEVRPSSRRAGIADA